MKIILKIGYIGTNYNGYSKQKTSKLTIENVLEKALFNLYKKNINIFSASRTDSGVHACSQMIQYDICNSKIPLKRIPYALNNLLPKDVKVFNIYITNNYFNVRYDCLKKTYKYIIDNNINPSIYLIPFSLHERKKLNLQNMYYSLKFLKGKHNFKAFCAKNSNYINFEREIYSVYLKEKNGILNFEITGNGFLYKMVRIIVGTLIEIGKNKLEKEIFLKGLLYKKRDILGNTAPGKGLILQNIFYKKNILQKIF